MAVVSEVGTVGHTMSRPTIIEKNEEMRNMRMAQEAVHIPLGTVRIPLGTVHVREAAVHALQVVAHVQM